MGSLGFDDVKMVVSETGWPSKGDENEVGANHANAAGYNGSNEVNGSNNHVGGKPSSSGVHTWCVAKEKLEKAFEYAWEGGGGADCRPLQEGVTCHDLDSFVARASYAFNSYYQKNTRKNGTCDFGGAAYVVTQSPWFGTCEFPSGYY
ncbi:glucosidase [Lithospermum erythrorhizon]|uniref:Glucosidase n=1 Tax=Lithospermum erythrorhizon TaxID=34254 RepID=A0AAV3PCI6_LITER